MCSGINPIYHKKCASAQEVGGKLAGRCVEKARLRQWQNPWKKWQKCDSTSKSPKHAFRGVFGGSTCRASGVGGAHGICGALCQAVWHFGAGKVAGALTAQAGSIEISLAG